MVGFTNAFLFNSFIALFVRLDVTSTVSLGSSPNFFCKPEKFPSQPHEPRLQHDSPVVKLIAKDRLSALSPPRQMGHREGISSPVVLRPYSQPWESARCSTAWRISLEDNSPVLFPWGFLLSCNYNSFLCLGHYATTPYFRRANHHHRQHRQGQGFRLHWLLMP